MNTPNPDEVRSHLAAKGLRHLALRVRNIAASRSFYEGLLGMKVVWEPDAENIYLSSGSDNLALHQIPLNEQSNFMNPGGQRMDHFGFVVENPEAVKSLFQIMQEVQVPIIKPLKTHRDGSVSFYMTDPDGNVIQILFEPHISP